MTRVISRKDLYNQDFSKAISERNTEDQQCSMMGFAEAMYYFYKQETNQTNEGAT